SLAEPDLVEAAKSVMNKMKSRGAEVPLPEDVVVAKRFAADAEPQAKDARAVAADDMILDIGTRTARLYADRIGKAGTVVWNGPVGVFEFDAFAAGTRVVAEAIA